MALQRTRRPRLSSGRSLRSLGSPLNARSLGATRNRQLLAGLLIGLWLFVPVSSPGATSPRIQFLGAENIPNNVGCVGFPPGTSDMQTLLAWAWQFSIVTKIDGRVEHLKLEETTESPARKGEWRNGDRIRQRFSSERITAFLVLTVTKECVEAEGCKTGTEYEGDLTIQVRGTGQQKTIRIEVNCGC
jgi:hypothetical protein